MQLLVLGAIVSCGEIGRGSPHEHEPPLLRGALVAENFGCARGCDEIGRGEMLVSIDGEPIDDAAALDRVSVWDGERHELRVRALDELRTRKVEIVAHTQPFVGADPWLLNRAPTWARRRMFAHASPIVQLVSIDGHRIDGVALVGRKRLLVYWDRGDRVEEAQAVAFMQVLQKAQADLRAAHVDIAFVHVQFMTGQRAAMNDAELREWSEHWVVREGGIPLPMIPHYRIPTPDERDPKLARGLAKDYRVLDNLGQSPAIVMLDERGIVRWHSEGVQLPPGDADVQDSWQYTIIEAVLFALQQL